jgi:hypothetical protein
VTTVLISIFTWLLLQCSDEKLVGHFPAHFTTTLFPVQDRSKNTVALCYCQRTKQGMRFQHLKKTWHLFVGVCGKCGVHCASERARQKTHTRVWGPDKTNTTAVKLGAYNNDDALTLNSGRDMRQLAR